MTSSLSWIASRGLERVLLQENRVSDLLQFLSDLDASPWRDLVGFSPASVERESLTQNKADLFLTDDAGRQAIVEMKIGHVFDARQQRRYEQLDSDIALYLAALSMDEQRLANNMADRWQFLSLAKLFGAWCDVDNEVARIFSQQITSVFQKWDANISAVFQSPEHTDVRPLSSLNEKSLTRVVTRRIAVDLQQRGRLTYAGVTSGGGLPLVQAWSPIRHESQDRCFMAEVRWRQNHPIGELRFGVDFVPRPNQTEDEEVRRAAYNLATSMDTDLEFQALQTHLQTTNTRLANLLECKRRSRPEAKGDWERIILHGFDNIPPVNNKKITRQQVQPAFYGDQALRFQAKVGLDFSHATALDVTELLDETLSYLVARQPDEIVNAPHNG